VSCSRVAHRRTRPDVQDAIDEIVDANLNDAPTVVVAHSLGTVVAYHILMNSQKHLNVPLFVTVGCPLGIRAIRDQFIPLASPPAVKAWINAFDTRDVVALYPLDEKNFAIHPPIENYSAVKNSTENHSANGAFSNLISERSPDIIRPP
jgi:pimeloyl-ACP methyl ester carboxylesterase